jgi:hypothetical protein
MTSAPTPPITTDGTVPNQVAVIPGFELAQFVRRLSEKPVDRAHAAMHRVGCRKLGERSAHSAPIESRRNPLEYHRTGFHLAASAAVPDADRPCNAREVI